MINSKTFIIRKELLSLKRYIVANHKVIKLNVLLQNIFFNESIFYVMGEDHKDFGVRFVGL